MRMLVPAASTRQKLDDFRNARRPMAFAPHSLPIILCRPTTPVPPIARTANSVRGRFMSSNSAGSRPLNTRLSDIRALCTRGSREFLLRQNHGVSSRCCDRIERPSRYLERQRHGKAGVAKVSIALDGALIDRSQTTAAHSKPHECRQPLPISNSLKNPTEIFQKRRSYRTIPYNSALYKTMIL